MKKIQNPDNIAIFKTDGIGYKKIQKVFQNFCPRKLKSRLEVIVEDWKGRDSYRGGCIGDTIVLYWSPDETPTSMAWVFAHELQHFIMDRDLDTYEPILEAERGIIRLLKKRKKNYEDDLYEISPIEAVCNLFANQVIGFNYGQEWLINREKRRKK